MKKLYIIICAMLVTFSAMAEDFYLIGGFNNWTLSDPACKFTSISADEYQLNYNGVLTSGFKLNNGTWSNDSYNFGSNGSKIVIGEIYTLKVGGSSGNIAMDGNIENPILTLNVANKTLLIEGQATEVKYAYAIHGQIFGNPDWSTLVMDEDEDGMWTLTEFIVPGEFGIKVLDADSGSQTDWYSCAEGEDNTLTIDNMETPLTAVPDGKVNWTSNLEGQYTFTFDPKEMKLFVKEANGVMDISTDNTDAPVYFNLQGIETANPVAGLYIEVRGSQVRKIAVK